MSLPALAPVVGVLVLVELAAGTALVTWLGDVVARVGRGFVGTTAAICMVVLGAGLALAAALPDVSGLLHEPVDPARYASTIHWSVALLVGLALWVFFCAVGTDGARRVVGLAVVVCGAVAVGQASATFGAPLLGGAAGAVAFAPAALLLGSVLGGMLLGHWYLIAPDLSFRPLRLAVYLIFVAVAVQAVGIAVALVAADGGARGDVLWWRYGASFWLLVVAAGLLVTVAVNVLTLHYARMRANQPATAMLYILIITALMGVVPAHLVYFQSKVPV